MDRDAERQPASLEAPQCPDAKPLRSKKRGRLVGKPKNLNEKPRSFVELIDEAVSKVPKKVWKHWPKDGSLNHDHYLYGTPKR